MQSECTSLPKCPCDFCTGLRAKHAAENRKKNEQNKIAEDFLRSYSQSTPS
jgi:hypothetical protein